mgnify:FL=1
MPTDYRKALWGIPGMIIGFIVHIPPLWIWWGFLMALDLVSGLIGAGVRGIAWNKRTAFRGGAKKALAIILALSANGLQQATQLEIDIAALVVFYFCVTETISIAENCAGAGLPVPAFLLRLLTAMKEQADPQADPKKGPQ